MSIAHRIFVVGCARSGTTILQSLIAAHPAVQTFPESRLMRSITPASGLARTLGLATRHARARLASSYAELEFDASACTRRIRVSSYIRDFVAQADTRALALGKTAWLEKTPDHVRHIDTLRRQLPDALFVHSLRNGHDNVCSLLDTTRKHPAWGPRPLTLEECADRWRHDALITLKHAGQPGHVVVRHDDLVRNPGDVLRGVMGCLGLPYDPSQLAGAGRSRVALPSEPWKSTVSGGIHTYQPDRYRAFLNPDETAWLQRALAPVQEQIDALVVRADATGTCVACVPPAR